MTGPDDAEPDEALASRAQRGSHAAFETLINRHKASLYRFTRRYVGQADDAYDVLQDTFITSWTALHRYDANRPFLPWLRQIALNKCRDFGRRKTVQRLFLSALAYEKAQQDGSAVFEIESEKSAIETERLRRLDLAIANLPAIYKEPLLLTTVAGLSQQEAAAVLKISAKAVEMRLSRARRKLAIGLRTKTGGISVPDA